MKKFFTLIFSLLTNVSLCSYVPRKNAPVLSHMGDKNIQEMYGQNTRRAFFYDSATRTQSFGIRNT
jgi:hypothetical protein